MPIFLDRHDMRGLTAADIAEAHRKDLELQDQYGVRFLTYWLDEKRGRGFCLIEAPDVQTAMRVHDEAHGDVALDVIEVDLSAVEAFLGRISDPAPPRVGAQPAHDRAFRAVMFTDIVDSTGMTARLGDARAVEMVRAHGSMVRRALTDHGQMAARICQDAEADSIVVSDAVRREITDRFDLAEARQRQLKGFSEGPVVLYQVGWRAGADR